MSNRSAYILWLSERSFEELRGVLGKGARVGCWDENAGVRGSATWEAQTCRRRCRNQRLKVRALDMLHSHFIDSVDCLQ